VSARHGTIFGNVRDGALIDFAEHGFSYIGMEAGNCRSILGQFDRAVTTFDRSLSSWLDELRRDQGLCLARLGYADAGRGDVRGACTEGRRAVEIVRAAPSARALRELQRLRVQLRLGAGMRKYPT
jgi:hypothetical protein